MKITLGKRSEHMMTFISQNLLDAFIKLKAEELMQNVRSNLESSISKNVIFTISQMFCSSSAFRENGFC